MSGHQAAFVTWDCMARCSRMYVRARSIVARVMFAPARNLETNLPSFTAMRPNVDSLIFLVLRKPSISERSCAWVSIRINHNGIHPKLSSLIVGCIPTFFGLPRVG